MKAIAALLMLASLTVVAAPERSVEKSVVVAATLDQVWDAWTTQAGITSFFAPDAKIDAKPGGAFQIYINPLAEAGFKGADDMQYLALQPKQMLSFTWSAPPHLATVRQQRTFVVLRFEPVSEKETRVTLHHTGWGTGDEWDKAFAYFDRAWVSVLANLKKRFETRPVDWTEWMNTLRKMQEQSAPKK